MKCQFVERAPGVWSCANEGCGNVIRTERCDDEMPCRGTCRAGSDPFKCAHIGEATGEGAKCKCQSASTTPVYRCDLHRLCTPLRKSTDPELLKWCGGCPDWTTTNPEEKTTNA